MTLDEIRALTKPHDLPADDAWMADKMLIRHAYSFHRQKCSAVAVAEGVKAMDSWAEHWGLQRHGQLEVEEFSRGLSVCGYFKIVDILRHSEAIREDERKKMEAKS